MAWVVFNLINQLQRHVCEKFHWLDFHLLTGQPSDQIEILEIGREWLSWSAEKVTSGKNLKIWKSQFGCCDQSDRDREKEFPQTF